MLSSAVKKIATILAVVPAVLAFESIDFPEEVAAGKGTTLTVVNDLSDGTNSFDAGFDSYRVYLATTPPGWGTGPVCYLVNSTSIDTTTLTLTIPPDVGPSGSFYSISIMEFNQDPNMDGPSGFEYSNTFSLSGGTGEWSEAELTGMELADGDSTPCTAYNCVRQCTNGVNLTSDDISVYKKYYDCASSCPGVTLPSWNDIISGDEGGDGSGDGSSDSSSGEGDSDSASAGSAYYSGSSAAPSASAATTFATAKGSAVTTASSSPATTSTKGAASETASSSTTSSTSSASGTPSSSGSGAHPTSNAGNQLSSGLGLLVSVVVGVLLV